MLKVNNKNTSLFVNFKLISLFSNVSIVDFEQANVSWECSLVSVTELFRILLRKNLHKLESLKWE